MPAMLFESTSEFGPELVREFHESTTWSALGSTALENPYDLVGLQSDELSGRATRNRETEPSGDPSDPRGVRPGREIDPTTLPDPDPDPDPPTLPAPRRS